MNELSETLEKLCEGLEKTCEEAKVILEIAQKHGNNPDIISKRYLDKKIEDGILANLSKASVFQLNTLKRSEGFFKYYDKKDVDKLIDIALKKRIRKEKLNKIKESE